jgi:hypothetical protein
MPIVFEYAQFDLELRFVRIDVSEIGHRAKKGLLEVSATDRACDKITVVINFEFRECRVSSQSKKYRCEKKAPWPLEHGEFIWKLTKGVMAEGVKRTNKTPR